MSRISAGQFVTPTIKLVRLLGQGAMGSVWAAEHLALGTEIAVKFMAPHYLDNEQSVTRFREEAQKTARIKSPHVTAVFDHGITPDGQPFIVMELLEGETLQERMKRLGPMPTDQVVRVVEQAAIGLESAHKLGIVHRDIKPANLFVLDVGGEPFVKVLDFGIAKHVHATPAMTSTGMAIGTPLYMSPEQFDDSKRIDHRADLWALGVVAYEALTGKCPFGGETFWQLCMAVQTGDFQLPSMLRADLPQAMDAWMKVAFSRNIDERFGSAVSMADAIAGVFRRIIIVPKEIGAAPTPLEVRGTEAWEAYEKEQAELQRKARGDWTNHESMDRDVKTLSLIGSVAAKAVAMGRPENAERILHRSLQKCLAQARTGEPVSPELALTAALLATLLASSTGKGSWLDYVFELYLSINAITPSRVLDDLYAVAYKAKPLDLGIVRTYIDSLRRRAASFQPSERLLFERIEGLEQLGELKSEPVPEAITASSHPVEGIEHAVESNDTGSKSFRIRCPDYNIKLPRGDFFVGRHAECQLSVEDPLLSRKHAVLHVHRSSVVVEDLGSRNGVVVNGVRIEGPRILIPGDKIQVASLGFILCADDESNMR